MRLSPSGSLSVDKQVRVESVRTPEVGAMDTLDRIGERLSNVTVVLFESVPPLESLTVAVQEMMSVGIAEVVDRSSVAPE